MQISGSYISFWMFGVFLVLIQISNDFIKVWFVLLDTHIDNPHLVLNIYKIVNYVLVKVNSNLYPLAAPKLRKKPLMRHMNIARWLSWKFFLKFHIWIKFKKLTFAASSTQTHKQKERERERRLRNKQKKQK